MHETWVLFSVHHCCALPQDPERVESLEELEVVKEDFVRVRRVSDGGLQITIMFTPTVPHCSLASLIGNYSGHIMSSVYVTDVFNCRTLLKS